MQRPLLIVATKKGAQHCSRIQCPWHLLEIGDSFVDRSVANAQGGVSGNWHTRARNQGIRVKIRKLGPTTVLVTRVE